MNPNKPAARHIRIQLPFMLAVVLAGCHAPAPAPVPQQPAAAVAEPAPPPPPAERIDHYRVDPDASQVLVLVYRDGPMAKMGHNHVIAVHQLAGDIAIPEQMAASRFWLEFPVSAMTVDDAAQRAALEEDFRAPVDAASIRGTREHMLGEKVLNALQFPKIRLESGPMHQDADRWMVPLLISVRGHSSESDVPVQVERSPGGLTATGEFDLTHAQLGLTPYSIGHGALRVAQTLHVRFRLVAHLDPDSAGTQAP